MAVDCPVLAAGGIMNGRDLASVMTLGADGAVLGTAFLATHESFAHTYHKERLIKANGDDIVLSEAFHINWPRGAKVHVLANSVTRGKRGDPFSSDRKIIAEDEGRQIYLFSTDSPLRSMRGDFEAMALYAGSGVGQVSSIVAAGDRVRAIVDQAVGLLNVGVRESRRSP